MNNLHCRSNVDRYISTVSTFLINKTLIHVWTVYPFTRFIRRSVYQFINISVYPVSVYPVPCFLPCHHSTSLCTDCIMMLYSPWKFVSLLVEPQLRYPDLGSWFWLVIVKLSRFWLAEFKGQQISDFSGLRKQITSRSGIAVIFNSLLYFICSIRYHINLQYIRNIFPLKI